MVELRHLREEADLQHLPVGGRRPHDPVITSYSIHYTKLYDIVQAINDEGGRAVGISGKDDDLMVCEADDPELGFVGRPVEMNVQVIRDLYSAGRITSYNVCYTKLLRG